MLSTLKKQKSPKIQVVETNVPFSQSCIWQKQRDYYTEKGISAWKEVPYQVSSNPYIAKQYALITLYFIQDWCKKNPGSEKETFYMLELGAGHGQFSFYFLKTLIELQKELNLTYFHFQYILSDISPGVIEFWKNHEKLRPFFDNGTADCAYFDLCKPNDLHLQISKKNLTKDTVINPLILIANYIFDSLPSDSFYTDQSGIYESVLTNHLKKSGKNNEALFNLTDLTTTHTLIKLNEARYTQSLQETLNFCANAITDAYFYFPITTLNALDHLKSLSKNGFLLITSDLNQTNHQPFSEKKPLTPKVAGTIYTEVNYSAMHHYLQNYCSEKLSISEDVIFSTQIFSCGFLLKEMTLLNFFAKKIATTLPASYHEKIMRYCKKESEHLSLNSLIDHLKLSEFDPNFFNDHCKTFAKKISDKDTLSKNFILQQLPLLEENYFFIPESDSVLFKIGAFLQDIKLYALAIDYYEKSLRYEALDYVCCINMGTCLYNLKKRSEAIYYFQKAMELNPKEIKLAKKWIVDIRREITNNL